MLGEESALAQCTLIICHWDAYQSIREVVGASRTEHLWWAPTLNYDTSRTAPNSPLNPKAVGSLSNFINDK